jgi:hypothetical protein
MAAEMPISLLEKSFFAGCSKMPIYKAPEILRSEECLGVRRRWAFFSNLIEGLKNEVRRDRV